MTPQMAVSVCIRVRRYSSDNKKPGYHRRTARRALLVEILPTAAQLQELVVQQIRNKSK